MLLLDDGRVAHGDCAAVQYSGVGGGNALFDATRAVALILEHVAPLLRGHELTDFRASPRSSKASCRWMNIPLPLPFGMA
jgi:methylaspartate ammonia-lyase